jgi:cytoskeletal protein CcmA (bactofilin family)
MAETSVIGEGTVVSGHIRGEGSLEILGRLEGDVSVAGNVVIGASGRVRGNVSCAQLTCAGQVQGDLRGTLAVLLEPGARVVGDISAPRVGIAPGALARGHVQTDGEPAVVAARPGVAAARAATPQAAPRPAALLPRAPVSPPPKAEPRPAAPVVKAPPSPKPELRNELRKVDAPKPAPSGPSEFAPVRPLKPEPRRPPPPVVPVISKGTKAKKKKSHD